MDSIPEGSYPRNILAGQLRRDFVVLPNGQICLDVPGGNLLYAAAGLAVWEPSQPPGLVARVGEDYPQEWLSEFSAQGFDVRGVHVLDQPVDLRSFFAYQDPTQRVEEDPMGYFSSIGQPFPKALLGYQADSAKPDSRTRLSLISLRQVDLIPEYLEATAAHICPLDFLTHSLLPEVRSLFHGRSTDLLEMAETLASYGCEIIVIKRGVRGQHLYDSATRKHYEVPAYDVEIIDPTGVGDAFCGGFLAGYRRTFDPVQAAIHGNISASLVMEGQGPFFALDSLPSLAQARLGALSQTVREM